MRKNEILKEWEESLRADLELVTINREFVNVVVKRSGNVLQTWQKGIEGWRPYYKKLLNPCAR